ncbi:hypothetical protein SY2F82_06500 [Streptomyces sp. Y2F8-2]|nr:hypothetical protein SY2F82_06500 [Streptomyces sp. Y2F8-2]
MGEFEDEAVQADRGSGAEPRRRPPRRPHRTTGPHRTAARPPKAYADIGRSTRMDCSSPTAIQTANIEEPP